MYYVFEVPLSAWTQEWYYRPLTSEYFFIQLAIADMRRNKEPLLHCAVFIELKAVSEDKLKELQSDILMELTRSKITVDRLILRQKEGMLSALPFGYNVFGSLYERVLPLDIYYKSKEV